jgi:hypothetical protein
MGCKSTQPNPIKGTEGLEAKIVKPSSNYLNLSPDLPMLSNISPHSGKHLYFSTGKTLPSVHEPIGKDESNQVEQISPSEISIKLVNKK